MRLITPSSLGLGLSIKTEMGKSMDSENIVQGEKKREILIDCMRNEKMIETNRNEKN